MRHLSFIRKQGIEALNVLNAKYVHDANMALPEYRYQLEWSALHKSLISSTRDANIFATDAEMMDYAAHRIYMLAQCVEWKS